MNWLDGQARTRWRDEQLGRFDNALRYYLGPTGIPDKLNGLARLLEFTDAGDMPEAARASQNLWNDPSLEAAIDYAVSGAALAIPFVGAKMINEGTDILGSAVDDFMTGYDPVTLRSGLGPRTSDDPASARGRGILKLITSGRASEVTDDMLDMGDPVMNARLNEYLWNNYDLPMDEASRMARAEGMGFTGGLYHGTPQDFTEFSGPGNLATARNWNYFSESPEFAVRYAEQNHSGTPSVLPVSARLGAHLDAANIDSVVSRLVEDTGAPDDIVEGLRDALARGADSREIYALVPPPPPPGSPEYEAWSKLRYRINDIAVHGMGQPGADYWENVERSNLMNSWGVDSFTSRERALADRSGGYADAANYGIRDPENIRSRFARFDPRLSHLRNLSAGIGALTLADILAKYGLQQEGPSSEAEIQSYLGGI